ncbi:hypothetical protein [Paraburkholderia phosphatilytica]|uniref:hypothetical protein n=1 Tax=Paraburkholderia phosphatilytica TaxID=2282883 RepID=UPI000E507468|nr:hypothetical protein [Paraburkholderia phosphatilytica]
MSISQISGGGGPEAIGSHDHTDGGTAPADGGNNLTQQRQDLGEKTAADVKNMLLHPNDPAAKAAYQQDMKQMGTLGQIQARQQQQILQNKATGSATN